MSFFRSPHFLLALTAFFWGGNVIAGKFAIGHVSPMALTFARWLIALIIMSVYAHKEIREDWDAIKSNWLYLLLMGGLGYTAFNYCLYSAVQYTSAINVALEQSAMPVVIFMLNFIIYRTGITWLQIAGYLATLVGVLVTISAGDLPSLFDGNGDGLNRGDIFMLGAALFYGGYSTALRSKPQMHWQSFLTAVIASALVFAIAGAVLEYQAGELQLPVTMQGVLVALFAGLLPSLVSQGFFIKGVEALGANLASLYINLVPVFAALLAVALLGEQLHLYHAIAFILVVGGILIAQRKKITAAPSQTPQ